MVASTRNDLRPPSGLGGEIVAAIPGLQNTCASGPLDGFMAANSLAAHISRERREELLVIKKVTT